MILHSSKLPAVVSFVRDGCWIVGAQVWRRFGIDYETCLSLDPKGPRVDPCEQVRGSYVQPNGHCHSLHKSQKFSAKHERYSNTIGYVMAFHQY